MNQLEQMQRFYDQLAMADHKPSHDLARLLPSEWLSESVRKSVEDSCAKKCKESIDNIV